MTTEVEQSKLNIHVLNQTQYEELPSVSDSDLYIVDPQFQGGKFLASDANGDIIEKDALQGVQVNGTDLTPDANNKVNIPIATNNDVGVVKGLNGNNGITVGSGGVLYTVRATDANIESKESQYKPIVPANLDKAIKEGLGNYTLTADTEWSEPYKEHAREVIGATKVTWNFYED